MSLFFVVSCSGVESVEVEKVIDGDSFRLKGGQEVRLIGIDAPEYGKPGADIAKDFLENIIYGRKIILRTDGENTDKYGRLLRHVQAGDIFINREMVKKGYARVKYILPGSKSGKDFLKLQHEAESSKSGLWAFGVFSSEKPLQEGIVSWKDVHNHYGEEVTVQGKVVRAYNSGKACFLNFHQDWKKHFTAVIFAKNFNKFPKLPEILYINKEVRVTGLVKKYRDAPEIIVNGPEQIKTIK